MALPPITLDRMWAMPTARVGAPPARDRIECSPTSRASCSSSPGVMWKPHWATAAAAEAASLPITAAGLFMAK